MKRSSMLGRYALISPAAILIFVFMLLPMLLMALMSWLEPGQFGGVKWGSYTPEAYVKFLFDRDLSDVLVFNTDYLSIFSRSFQLAFVTTVLTLLVAFPVAFYIALQTPKHRTWLMLLITIPFWTNLLVRTYAWILLLRNGGLIDSSLHSLGVMSTPINLMYTPIAVQIGLVYAFLPFMVLPIYTSLEKLDWRLLEAAYDLYANRWQTMWRIVIPLAAPGMVAGCILVFVPALGTFFIPELLGGAKTLMIGNLIQQQFGVSRNWPFGAALSFALLAVVLIFMLIYALRFRGKGSLTQ
jgi:spermidine/putrescine transport system permease protein